MMEKKTATRRSLLRALYLLPLVCICLAVNAQTKVQYRYVYDYSVLGDSTVTTPDNKFTMSAYKIPQGTDMDSLIRSLPGVQVNEKGEITVNGKAVAAKVQAVTARVQAVDDTILFNSSNYKLPDGESVEDLINKLPGVGTDDDGNITVNGKRISRVLVNGEELNSNKTEQAAAENNPTKNIDENGNFTIDTQNGTRVNLNGTQVTK